MTSQRCGAFLTHASVARLDCSLEEQSYVVPFTLTMTAYNSFSPPGDRGFT